MCESTETERLNLIFVISSPRHKLSPTHMVKVARVQLFANHVHYTPVPHGTMGQLSC